MKEQPARTIMDNNSLFHPARVFRDCNTKRTENFRLCHRTLPVLTFFFMVLILINFIVSGCIRDSEIANDSESEPDAVSTVPSPTMTPTIIPTVTYHVKNGDTISAILTKKGIEPVMINQLLEDCCPAYNLANIHVGRELSYHLDGNLLLDLSYPIDNEQILVANFNGSSFQCEVEKLAFEYRIKRFEGTIYNNLWEAARQAGLEPSTLVELASIFDWVIDFNTELRKEDSFSVLVEERYFENEYHHCGRVIAARMAVNNTESFAFNFEDPSGRADYFDEQGKCLRKNFLKAPLQYQRISSGYTAKRYHPILKIVRPHWGIDYAAPSGTPVRAVGDGLIVKATRDRNYGIFVRIKHGSSPYETAYGHLKGFAKGIRNGVRVKQGQIIGYVGATGLATGPHLDYRVYHHGKPINPAAIKTSPVAEVAADFQTLYQQLVDNLKVQLKNTSPEQEQHIAALKTSTSADQKDMIIDEEQSP